MLAVSIADKEKLASTEQSGTASSRFASAVRGNAEGVSRV